MVKRKLNTTGRSIIAMFLLLTPILVRAANGNSADGLYENLGIYLIGGLTLLVSIAAFSTLLKLLDLVGRNTELKSVVEPQPKKTLDIRKSQEPLLARLYKLVNRSVPLAREKEILLDHNYDGIKELDNNLPPWWLAMFYVSIIYGVFYIAYYHFSDYGISSEQAYRQEMEMAAVSVNTYLAGQLNTVDENTVVVALDEEALSNGKFVYQINCVVCHLESGGGLVGPNLTDEFWLHGGDIKDIFKTIKYGVPEKGMIAWGTQLRPSDIQNVSSYILSLAGTNPPNAKAAEGEKYIAGDGESR